MKKRSKLDLTAGVEQSKPQAKGFEQPAPADPAPEWRYARAHDKPHARERRRRRARALMRSSTVVVIRTVAIVAVAALTLYTLRRRFL